MKETRMRSWEFKLLVLASVAAAAALGGVTGCVSMDEFDPYAAWRDEGLPFIKGIDPAQGSVGTQIAVVGELFGDTQGTGKVVFYGANDGGAISVAIDSWSATSITCRVPSVPVPGQAVPVEVVRGDGVKSANTMLFLVTLVE